MVVQINQTIYHGFLIDIGLLIHSLGAREFQIRKICCNSAIFGTNLDHFWIKIHKAYKMEDAVFAWIACQMLSIEVQSVPLTLTISVCFGKLFCVFRFIKLESSCKILIVIEWCHHSMRFSSKHHFLRNVFSSDAQISCFCLFLDVYWVFNNFYLIKPTVQLISVVVKRSRR